MLPALLASVGAALTAPRTLILQTEEIRVTHSSLIRALSARGHHLTYADPVRASLRTTDGGWKFDNVLLLANHLASLPAARRSDLLAFAAGRNLLVAVGPAPGVPLRTFLLEFGIELDADNWYVQDDLGAARSDAWTGVSGDSAWLPGQVLYEGLGLTAPNFLPLLRAPSTASSGPVGYGRALEGGARRPLLGAAREGRGRFVALGSMAVLSDRVFATNEKFVEHLLSWIFQQRDVLRVSEIRHEGRRPGPYLAKDELTVTFELDILNDGVWEPYVANDVQLEASQHGVFVRSLCTPPRNGSTYTASILAPDAEGPFALRVHYERLGLSPIDKQEVAFVRAPDKDSGRVFDLPHVAAVGAALLAVLLTSGLILYHA